MFLIDDGTLPVSPQLCMYNVANFGSVVSSGGNVWRYEL
jgi:hypothetical protein